MGLKGFRLWVMGPGSWVNLIQRAEPHRYAPDAAAEVRSRDPHHGVALQVAFF
jgi:hypothetical protein